MKFSPTPELPEVIVVEPEIFQDSRGFFLENYNALKFSEGGITASFVQDNHSKSVKNVLRGLHAQIKFAQGKLVRVLKGKIFDVAVDIRVGSPTFKKWVGVTLSADNFRQVYVPPGFAHGFCVLSDEAEVSYKCTDFYHKDDEVGVLWNDPEVGIKWPIQKPILSDKDAKAKTVSSIREMLPLYKTASLSR